MMLWRPTNDAPAAIASLAASKFGSIFPHCAVTVQNPCGVVGLVWLFVSP